MLFDQIARNKRKTWLLLLVFFLLLGLVGYGVGYLWLGSGFGGLILALVIGFIYAVTMIFQSTNVVMAMNGAREVDEQTAPNLYHVVEDMAMVAQIPMPRVFIVDDPSMNAFATGSSPKNAAVAATTGLLAVMNREELEGVIGHEVSHIRNYDIRISTIAVALASAITMLAGMARNMMFWGGGRRRNDDDRNAQSLVDIPDQLQNRMGRLRIQGAGGLVAEQHLRIGGQGSRNGDTLLLAAGELGRIGIGLIGKPNHIQ